MTTPSIAPEVAYAVQAACVPPCVLLLAICMADPRQGRLPSLLAPQHRAGPGAPRSLPWSQVLARCAGLAGGCLETLQVVSTMAGVPVM